MTLSRVIPAGAARLFLRAVFARRGAQWRDRGATISLELPKASRFFPSSIFDFLFSLFRTCRESLAALQEVHIVEVLP